MERAKSFVVRKKASTISNGHRSHGLGEDFPKSMFDLGRSSSFVIARQLTGNNPLDSPSIPNPGPIMATSKTTIDVEDVIKQFQQGSHKPKFKMKEETKLFLKLHIIHQKAIHIDGLLKSLLTLTDTCREVSSDLNDNVSEEFSATEQQFVNTVLEVETEVRVLQRLVLYLCRHKCLERHLGVLSSIPDQMKSSYDISVQFFGIDWPHIFRISNNLIQLISEMVDLLREGLANTKNNNNGSGLDFDIVIPSNILRNLATIEAEITWHAEAVLRGRLSPTQQESISLEQKRHQALKLQLDQQVKHDSKAIGPKMMKPSVWAVLKGLQLSMMRRSRRKYQRSNDDLWRLWYQGVHSMTTLSLGGIATPNQSERDELPDDVVCLQLAPMPSPPQRQQCESSEISPNCQPASPGNVGETWETPSAWRRKAIAFHVTQPSMERVPSDLETVSHSPTPPPSKQEQKDVLGVYSAHWDSVTPTLADRRKRMNQMVPDDTLESLQLAEVVDAPTQRVDESEL